MLKNDENRELNEKVELKILELTKRINALEEELDNTRIEKDDAIRVVKEMRLLKTKEILDRITEKEKEIARERREFKHKLEAFNAEKERIKRGEIEVVGQDQNGALLLKQSDTIERVKNPVSVWNQRSHNAGAGGSNIVRSVIPGRRFPFPKSLYAVEDALRFFVVDKPDAVDLDFFSGSGTTAHAVMRLNRQDDGRRQCISVTNNEVAADEQAALRKAGLRPGDADWEKWGICEYITKPRITAAITGKTPEGNDIEGDYKFTDEFPMAEGFEENAEFFTLTYENPVGVSHNRAFARIAPLLWMRAGSKGRRIEQLPEQGWEVADTYGLLTDLDQAAAFSDAVEAKNTIRIAFIVTDDERRFQSVARHLPSTVEPVRLYEAYLTNFRFSLGQ